jgi:hypothetical protein
MRIALVATILLALAIPSAHAVEAAFLGTTTYATPAGCAKVARLAAGIPRNLNSVPETLTAKGYMSWEGGCTIEKITPKVAGKSWSIVISCSEGAEESVKSTETWTSGDDGSILINAQGKKTRFVACAASKKKE